MIKPSFQSIGQEIVDLRRPDGLPSWDDVRRKKLADLESYTHRPSIIYAVDFMNADKAKAAGSDIQIDFSDKDGLFEVINGIDDTKNIDVILHSPGGRPEAAESLVAMLRAQFDNIRFIIPNVAKSAATMMAMSGNEILMDANAELGPVDPQLVFRKGDGSVVQAPAQAIVDQFEEAQTLIGADAAKLPAWLPILQQYGPSLYKEAKNAIALSQMLVKEWLTRYMFDGDSAGSAKATDIAAFLSDHNEFKSDGRRIGREVLQSKGARITNTEDDAELHNRVLAVYFAIAHTFTGPAFKFFESSRGRGLYRLVQQVQVQVPALPGVRPAQPKP